MEEQFYTFRPTDPIVSQYVDYYYVHRCGDPNFHRQYRFYPHLKHAISIYQQAHITAGLNASRILASQAPGFTAIYTQVMTAPFEVEMLGPVNKIAIVFKPMGLLYFLPGTLDSICKETVNPFNPYGLKFDELMKSLFDEKEDQRQVLDEFFGSPLLLGKEEDIIRRKIEG